MQTKRYYYDCPYIAGYMSEYFDVRLLDITCYDYDGEEEIEGRTEASRNIITALTPYLNLKEK